MEEEELRLLDIVMDCDAKLADRAGKRAAKCQKGKGNMKTETRSPRAGLQYL